MNRTIHQTWKNAGPFPSAFKQQWIDSWSAINPNWTYKLWTDEDLTDYVAEKFPGFFPVWCSYPKQIMRVDAWRYLVLLEQGGLYVDLDFVCLEPLDDWILAYGRFSCANQGDGSLCNAFMWAPLPDPAFLRDVVTHLTASAYDPNPLTATGPYFLNTYACDRSEDYDEFPTEEIYPIKYWDRSEMSRAGNLSLDDLRKNYPKSRVATFWSHSWSDQTYSVPIIECLEDAESAAPHATIMVAMCANHQYKNLALAQLESFYSPRSLPLFLFEDSGEAVEHQNFQFFTGTDLTVMVAACRALVASNYDWAFICSAGTYVVPERLGKLVSTEYDLIANESLMIERRPKRSSGYLISRRLAGFIADSGLIISEDNIVPFVKDRGLNFHTTHLLRHDGNRIPMPSNTLISAYSEDIRRLFLMDATMFASCSIIAKCAHENWHGEIHFYENRFFLKASSGDGGTWRQDASGKTELHWFDGPIESFVWVASDSGILLSAEHARHVIGVFQTEDD